MTELTREEKMRYAQNEISKKYQKQNRDKQKKYKDRYWLNKFDEWFGPDNSLTEKERIKKARSHYWQHWYKNGGKEKQAKYRENWLLKQYDKMTAGE